ncbi:MAG: 5-formyltetrahydrofolate cyclo-ligase [Leptolyngbyaceae bacterium]|nr:5-formyltetrahydrofolate cyclo-ligase [Leptolyngbyaceae bacterium]
MLDGTADKATLRRSLLAARNAMSPDEWRVKSDRLCEQLQQIPLFQQSRTVLAYSSFRNEPDLSPLFDSLSCHWGMPRCVGKTMEWHRWSPRTGFPLQKGAFGILEPDPQSPRLNAEDVDLILVPAVACDRRGYRLGYGGGFYDRMFSDPAWKHIPTIGIVFSTLLLDTLPIDAWDCSLHSICTDTQWISIRQ